MTPSTNSNDQMRALNPSRLCLFGLGLSLVLLDLGSGWYIAWTSNNHRGFSAFGLSLTLAAAATLLGIYRCVAQRRLLASAIWIELVVIASIAFLWKLDSCNFLVEYNTWADRGLPDPNPDCCSWLWFAKTCKH